MNLNINNKLSEISELIKNNLYYGYPYSCNDDLPLILLSKANVDCYNKEQLKKYKDRLDYFLYSCTSEFSDIHIDSSNREKWERENPTCLNRKAWERIALKICYDYKLDVFLEKLSDNCNLDLSIVRNIDNVCNIAFDITKKIITCDILTAISIQQKMCDLNIVVERTRDECILDYKILIEKFESCNLSKKDYVTLIDSNFSYEIISAIYNNNLKLEVTSSGVNLLGPISSYKIGEDLRFDNIIVDSTTKDLIFPKTILNEYKITNNIKEKLLNELYFV